MSEDIRSTRDRSSPPTLAWGQAQVQPHAPAIGRRRRVARLAVLALLILALALVSVGCGQQTRPADGSAPSPEGQVAKAAKAAPPEADLAETSSSGDEAEAALQLEPVVEAPLEVTTLASDESTVDEADVLDQRPDLSSRSDRATAEQLPEAALELPLDSVSVADKIADARARAEAKRAAEAKAQAEAKAKAEAEAKAKAVARARAQAEAAAKAASERAEAEARARAAREKAAAEARARAQQAARLAAQRRAAAATPRPVVTTAASSSIGAKVASIALRYVGYRYSWAGTSPSTGFDCSGFTYYVYKVAGRPISRDLAVQYRTGQWVSRSQLQPGDLVFFQNTYKPGLSHSGIYIGGGKMINAQDEDSGVAIASIDSRYWGPRFLGGRRP